MVLNWRFPYEPSAELRLICFEYSALETGAAVAASKPPPAAEQVDLAG